MSPLVPKDVIVVEHGHGVSVGGGVLLTRVTLLPHVFNRQPSLYITTWRSRSPYITRFADCAVCNEGYAPGSGRRCHACSEENAGFALGVSTTVLLLVVFVVVSVVSYLLQMVGDGPHDALDQPRRWWRGKRCFVRRPLVESLPLSTIRIVVVVLQIVIQVSNIEDSLKLTRLRYIAKHFQRIRCRYIGVLVCTHSA